MSDRWSMFWCGWLAYAAWEMAGELRWGWAALFAGFAAVNYVPKTKVDRPTAAIASALMRLKDDEMAEIEVVTRDREKATFTVWRRSS